MPTVSDTAYVRLVKNPSDLELAKAFTPTDAELEFAATHTRQPGPRLMALLYLKTFQRTGYFTAVADIPVTIVRHIAERSNLLTSAHGMSLYDESTHRTRIKALVRDYLDVRAYDDGARRIAVTACVGAAATRDDLPDIINIALEQLVLHRFELPAFDALLRIARTARNAVNRRYHHQIASRLTEADRERLGRLLSCRDGERRSAWDGIKEDANRPSVKRMREFITHVKGISSWSMGGTLKGIPEAKVAQFAAEAASLNTHDISRMREGKRVALIAALIRHRHAGGLDAMATMFIRLNRAMHAQASEQLDTFRKEQAAVTDALVARLHRAVLACSDNGLAPSDRLRAVEGVLLDNADMTLSQCESHTATAGNNYLPFLGAASKGRRSAFLAFLEYAVPTSTSHNTSTEAAIQFLLAHRSQRTVDVTGMKLNLDFVMDAWWPYVTGQRNRAMAPKVLNRTYFELCLFAHIAAELSAGDLYIPGSIEFADCTAQIISDDEYERDVGAFCVEMGFPETAEGMVSQLKAKLDAMADSVDRAFPDNDEVRILDGQPVVGRSVAVEKTGTPLLERLVKERLPTVDILTALTDTELWLNWTRFFGPISGMDAKIPFIRERYLATTFCYGCALGPSQTARSLAWLERRQVALPNHRHVTETDLDQAIAAVVDAYARIDLHRFWGDGRSAAADGTKLDTHPQSLMTEFHIRYGGYGGIGYYLISDTYIALFSRFIACGAYEGHSILDFVAQHSGPLQPDTIHSDTHGQSTPIFGLAHMLGIDLMPRIKNWANLTFYRSSRDVRYEHINGLFTDTIDWKIIADHIPDVLRVAMSIKAGKLLPSTILRRLGTRSRKNRLYFAFRELGRVIRTVFLLRYLSSGELRRTIGAETNKVELFHQFAQWASFGNAGLVHVAARDEQRKLVKYNHLVADLLIFHTTAAIVGTLARIRADGFGHAITPEALSGLTPYLTEHINRFGKYDLDFSRVPEPVPYEVRILP